MSYHHNLQQEELFFCYAIIFVVENFANTSIPPSLVPSSPTSLILTPLHLVNSAHRLFTRSPVLLNCSSRIKPGSRQPSLSFTSACLWFPQPFQALETCVCVEKSHLVHFRPLPDSITSPGPAATVALSPVGTCLGRREEGVDLSRRLRMQGRRLWPEVLGLRCTLSE